MPTNEQGRIVKAVAVSGGYVYYGSSGDTIWTQAAMDGTSDPPLRLKGYVESDVNNQIIWFVDGSNYVYFDPLTNKIKAWVASAGVLPVDSSNRTARLIATWRGRTVLAGLLGDPQGWFMSAVGDPTDFDYSPPSITSTQAVAGVNAPQGKCADIITSLVPYSDDILLMGCDHSIFLFRGDPMAGGQLDIVTDAIGFAWGRPWATDPWGGLYFVSNRMGIYSMVPGQSLPQRISQPIEQYLQLLNIGDVRFRMVWNDRMQGLHVFCTYYTSAAQTTHFFWEKRTNAWWVDQFVDANKNPLVATVHDGNSADDRVPIIGCWDGYVRALKSESITDDGDQINSDVIIGPIATDNLDEMLVKDIQALMGLGGTAATYSIYVANAPEDAIPTTNPSAVPVVTGTWLPGRNLTNLIRRSGYVVYIRITGTSQWAMESIRVRVATQGKVRRRGR